MKISGAETARFSTDGNLKIGGTATRATTEGTKYLDIFDGTAPVGTLAAGISLYSTSGELRVMDSGGTATLLSPHENVNNYWVFDSTNANTGYSLVVDMELMIKRLNETFGWDYVHETINGVKLEIADSPASPPDSFSDKFFNNIFAKITTWLADAANGVGSVFANVFNAKE